MCSTLCQSAALRPSSLILIFKWVYGRSKHTWYLVTTFLSVVSESSIGNGKLPSLSCDLQPRFPLSHLQYHLGVSIQEQCFNWGSGQAFRTQATKEIGIEFEAVNAVTKRWWLGLHSMSVFPPTFLVDYFTGACMCFHCFKLGVLGFAIVRFSGGTNWFHRCPCFHWSFLLELDGYVFLDLNHSFHGF